MPEWLLPIPAYLIGSIPVGLLIARAKGVDIRAHGSGNVGATNVGRVLGRRFGFLCFGLDAIKGFVPTFAAGFVLRPLLSGDQAVYASFVWLGVAGAAIAGHMFPIFAGFKGGKGVATGFGALAGVWPVLTFAALGAFVVWGVGVLLTRMVGIASVFAAIALPACVAIQAPAARVLGLEPPIAPWPCLAMCIALAAVVVYRHRGNIARTLAGTEPKIGRKPVASPSVPATPSPRA